MAGYPLTEAQRTYYDEIVYDVMRDDMIGRNLIALAPGSPFGFGVQVVDFNTISDMSAAELSYKMTENTDMIGMANSKIGIPILHKEWEIDRRDLASSHRTGIPLDSIGPATAAAKVAELENALIIQGWDPRGGSSYEIKGLYNTTGVNTYGTSKDFATAGNATDAVIAAVDLMIADKIKPPYNLTLNPTQFTEILGPRSTSSDTTELQVVKDILAGGDGNGRATGLAQSRGGGNVFVSTSITAGTGMVTASPNPRYADLAVAQDAVTEYEILPKSKNMFGRVFECLIPRVREPTAICTLTAI